MYVTMIVKICLRSRCQTIWIPIHYLNIGTGFDTISLVGTCTQAPDFQYAMSPSTTEKLFTHKKRTKKKKEHTFVGFALLSYFTGSLDGTLTPKFPQIII